MGSRRKPESSASPMFRRIGDEERWTILRGNEIYKACTEKLEETVSDPATKKFIRGKRMRYAFVWIFLTMNGLEEPFSEYSSRIRDAIVNAKDRKDPKVSQDLMQACNAHYARHPIRSTTQPVPLPITSMQVKCSVNIVFDEDAQSYQISPVNPDDQDPMLNIAPCLLEVGASGTCIDEMRLLLQTPWTLDRSASSNVFLRGAYAGAVEVRVDKSPELYGRRQEILIPWKLREFLKKNEPADVKVHICLQMHSLSVFLNQVLQHAFEGFRPVSRLYLVCQFSKNVDRSVEKTFVCNSVALVHGDVQQTLENVPWEGVELTHVAPSTFGVPRNKQTVLSPPPQNVSTDVPSYSLPHLPLISQGEARTATDTSVAVLPLDSPQRSPVQTVQGPAVSHSSALLPYEEEYLHSFLSPLGILSGGQCFQSVEGPSCPTLDLSIPNVDCTSTNFDGTVTEKRSTSWAGPPMKNTGINGASSSDELCAQSSTFTHWNEAGSPRQNWFMDGNEVGWEGFTASVRPSPDLVRLGQPSWSHTGYATSMAPAVPSPQPTGLGQDQIDVQTPSTSHVPVTSGIFGERFDIFGEDGPMLHVEVEHDMQSAGEGFLERPYVNWSTSEGGDFLPALNFLMDDVALDLSLTGSVIDDGTEDAVPFSGGTLAFHEDISSWGGPFSYLSFAREGGHINDGVIGQTDASGQATATPRPDVGYVVDYHGSYQFIDPNGIHIGRQR